jgi:hypothetical protein
MPNAEFAVATATVKTKQVSIRPGMTASEVFEDLATYSHARFKMNKFRCQLDIQSQPRIR